MHLHHLQKKEEPSEILVCFEPSLTLDDKKTLSIHSEASIGERIQTLRDIQAQVDDIALSVFSKTQPTKSEASLPGYSLVDQDLSALKDKRLDASWLTNMVRMTATPSMIRKLVQSKRVAFVIPNFKVRLPDPVEITEADVKSIQERQERDKCAWGLGHLRIPEIWGKGFTGRGIAVGHLDTGIDASHPDLHGKVKEFGFFDPRGQMVKCEAFDSDNHGTHTAGIIVGGKESGISIGVAPEAELISALVLPGGVGTIWQIEAGIRWVIDHKVKIINISLGISGYDRVYENTFQKAFQAGSLPVCAIGNNGLAVTGSPGNLQVACGVGAIDQKEIVPPFSGGGTIRFYSDHKELLEMHKPDIVAPGVGVPSSLPRGGWGDKNGTSMAAPHVAGVLALLIQAKPDALPKELLDAIRMTAKHPLTGDHSANGECDSRWGWGVLDPNAALERLTHA